MNTLRSNKYALISVIMPAFNAEKTILKALHSLIFQTYRTWECVVVDDGSTDNTCSIVKNVKDERIKYVRLEKNMGRGFARQVALDNCNGSFLAMLDSDDWIHPFKLETQIQVFMDYSEVDLVSCGIGVIDKHNELFGVRAKGDTTVKTFALPGKVPVAHAPSMLRMKFAKQLDYDKRFLLAQDVDFLRRYLVGKKYIIIDSVFYYYTEHESSSLKKISSAYLYNIKGFFKFFPTFPVIISINIFDQLIKMAISNVYGVLGQFATMMKRRTAPPSPKDLSDFVQCKKSFELFGG